MNRIYLDYDWAESFLENIFSHQDISNISRDNGVEKILEIDRISGLNRLASAIEAHQDSSVVSNDEIKTPTRSEARREHYQDSSKSQDEHLPEAGFDDLFRNDD